MNEQRHVIKRQMIELQVGDVLQAQHLQAEASRIYRNQIIPLIDRCCTELGSPDRIHRIESLELDLGSLDPQSFEEEFVAQVSAALRRELAAQIDTQEQAAARPEQGPKTLSQLELFAFFIRTGSLPWWAQASQPGLLTENLRQLLDEVPDALRRLLLELTPVQRFRRRLAAQYTDDQLLDLFSLLLPAYRPSLERDFQSLGSILQQTGATAVWQPRQLRHSLWSNILQVAGPGSEQHGTLQAFYRAVLQRVAAELGSTGNDLLAGMSRAIQENPEIAGGELKGIITTLAGPQTGAPSRAGTELARRLAQLQSAGGPLADTWAALLALASRLPARLRAEWLAVLRSGLQAETIAQRLGKLIPTEVAQDGPIAVGRTFRKMDDEEDAPDPHADRTDELYIENAGLVILWPFLGSFFARLGLLDDRQFRDLAAQQRAVGLLQVIAAQAASLPEYLLPLNKLLCGLELHQVFDFGPALLDSEAQECEQLLEAVIAQAPILHDMSAAGFRNTFLLRAGMLSIRDGFWLLRVERETYDVVLERFPWNWEWVKLPWMEAPLRVEW